MRQCLIECHNGLHRGHCALMITCKEHCLISAQGIHGDTAVCCLNYKIAKGLRIQQPALFYTDVLINVGDFFAFTKIK